MLIYVHTKVSKFTVAEIYSFVQVECVNVHLLCTRVCVCFDLWEHQHMFSICTAGTRRIEFCLSLSKKAEGLEKVAKHLSKNSTQKCFFK